MGGKWSKYRTKSAKSSSARKKQEGHHYEEIRPRMLKNSAQVVQEGASNYTSTEPRPSTSRAMFGKNKRLLTAAIDFGTSYSGYAYSFVHDPTKVYVNFLEGANIKTPTVVLLNPDKTFAAFGVEAEETYLKLVKAKEAENWYYFERFKMELYRKPPPLEKNMTLLDMTGKSVRALDVFSAAIRYFKNHLLDVFNEKSEYVSMLAPDIHWVLTVPAIWTDSAKQFMREAAREAGIDDGSLTIALEPEVSSVYCKARAKDDTLDKKDSDRIGPFEQKTKYMVLDLGGGTADITCHEVLEDGNLAELHHATGGDYGGTNVDVAFRQFLIKIFGADVIHEFKSLYLDEYFELLNNFERKKRVFDGKSGMVIFSFPALLLDMHKRKAGVDIKCDLSNNPVYSNITFSHGKIKIPSSHFKNVFDTTVSGIIQQVSELLKSIPDLSYIIMVGGFSESPYVYSRMREQFGDMVFRPKEPSGTVLKGALLFGEHHTIITKRISKYSYGIARMMRFRPDTHPLEKIKEIDGFLYVDDVFNSHIEVGQSIEIGQDVEGLEYFPPTNGLTQAVLEVYASKNRNPQYITDEGCFFVGLLAIDLSPYQDHRHWPLRVKILFGGTELTVEVLEIRTNKNLTVTLNLVD